MPEPAIPGREDLAATAERLRGVAHRTPVLTSTFFNEATGGRLFFKCENFQRVGAFKFRGAMNALLTLSEKELENGVVTHSSGNHAQAIALSARLRGAKAYIVMHDESPAVKVAAVRGYGAEIIFCKPTQEDRERNARRVMDETGAVFIHPYNDPRIVCGQSTAARELLEDVDSLDVLVTPVGGGGLLSGTALAAHYLSPGTTVYGAEPRNADDAYRSLQSGKIEPSINPQTLADGLLTSLGDLTFAVIRRHVEAIVTVTEEEIVKSMRHMWERMKIVVEPSAAVPVAALFRGHIDAREKRVGVILSGGNVDLERLPWNVGD